MRFTRSFLAALVILLGACNNSTDGSKQEKNTPVLADTVQHWDSDSAKPVSEDQLIVPGKQIGLISLNEPADSVIQKLGKPDEGDAAMGKALSTWYRKDGTAGTSIFFVTNMGEPGATSRVKIIRVRSAYFKTAANIAVGDHFTTIQNQFPQAKLVGSFTDKSKEKHSVYFDKKQGIGFEISKEQICGAIFISASAVDFSTGYLPFYPNFLPANDPLKK